MRLEQRLILAIVEFAVEVDGFDAEDKTVEEIKKFCENLQA